MHCKVSIELLAVTNETTKSFFQDFKMDTPIFNYDNDFPVLSPHKKADTKQGEIETLGITLYGYFTAYFCSDIIVMFVNMFPCSGFNKYRICTETAQE